MIREYIALQGESIYDILMKTYGDMRGLQPLVELNEDLINSKTRELVGGGVKTTASNSEFLIHNGTLWPTDTTTLTIDIEFDEYTDTGANATILSCSDPAFAPNTQFELRTATGVNDFISLLMNGGGGLVSINTTTVMPKSGKISIRGDATTVGLYLNDVLIGSANTVISFASFFPVTRFSAFGIAGGNETQFENITYTKITFQSNIWTFTEGTGSTATSNAGQVLTLNSSGTINDMWIPQSLGAIDFQGDVFLWDDETIFTFKTTPSFRKEKTALPPFVAREGQTIYDLAVQLYGDISEGLDNIRNLPLEIVNGVVKPGTEIPRTVPVSNVGERFNNNNVLVATYKQKIVTPVESSFDYLFDFVFEGTQGDTEAGLESSLEFPLVG